MINRKVEININKEIGVGEWERFEELADYTQELWEIFWFISGDKEKIIEKKMCSFEYFGEYIMPTFEIPIKNMLSKEILIKSDIETIISLYIKLLPETKCSYCDGLTCFVQKMSSHYKVEYR